MFRALIILLLIPEVGWGYGFGMGLGLETRAQQDVNPAMYEAQFIGLGSLQYRSALLGLSLESGYESSESNGGALSIQSRTISVMGWGRRDLRPAGVWVPFLSLGAGVYFDRVISTFLGSSDQRHGQRGALGAGAGLSYLLTRNYFLEAEGRTHIVEDRKDVSVSVIFRLGIWLDGEAAWNSGSQALLN